LITVMVVGMFLYNVSKRNLHTESGSAEPTAISPQPKLESVDQRRIVHNPVRGVQHLVAAKPGTAEATNAARVDDSAELWKAVKRGNVSAEVALANLYLEGKSVPQNCGQAHTLLHAASMKGSKAADTLLKSSYAERCQWTSPMSLTSLLPLLRQWNRSPGHNIARPGVEDSRNLFIIPMVERMRLWFGIQFIQPFSHFNSTLFISLAAFAV
jgi:hypothetical protein